MRYLAPALMMLAICAGMFSLQACPTRVQDMLLTEYGSGEFWIVRTTPRTIERALSVYEVYTAPEPLFGTGLNQVGGVMDKLPEALLAEWQPRPVVVAP
jgi:hypothetical protein